MGRHCRARQRVQRGRLLKCLPQAGSSLRGAPAGGACPHNFCVDLTSARAYATLGELHLDHEQDLVVTCDMWVQALAAPLPRAPATLTLLAFLNLAIEHDAGELEVSRRANKLAWHLGVVRTGAVCKGMTAACLCIMQPYRFKSRRDTARACNTSEASCYKWIKRINDKIRDEKENNAASCSATACPTVHQDAQRNGAAASSYDVALWRRTRRPPRRRSWPRPTRSPPSFSWVADVAVLPPRSTCAAPLPPALTPAEQPRPWAAFRSIPPSTPVL